MKKFLFIFIFVSFSSFVGLAQEGADVSKYKLYPKQFKVNDSLNVAMIILAPETDEKKVENIIIEAIERAKQIERMTDTSNPESELSEFNRHDAKRKFKATPILFSLTEKAIEAKKVTEGMYDPFENKGRLVDNDVYIIKSSKTITKSDKDITASYTKILPGFIADSLIEFLKERGIENALVRINTIFKGIGVSKFGPWKVQIEDDQGTYARKAIFVTVNDSATATLSAKNFREISTEEPKCKGSTVFAKDATTANALAYLVIRTGAMNGKKMLEKFGYKGLIVDNNSNFLKTSGL